MLDKKKLPFYKMQGAGNDYVYLNLFDPEVSKNLNPSRLPDLARQMSNRNFGVGADGLVTLQKGTSTAYRMTMFNADGSEAEMCGNAIRCVARLIFDLQLSPKESVTIETRAGNKEVQRLQTPKGLEYKVNMGIPQFEAALIPSTLQGPKILDYSFEIGAMEFIGSLVNLGNPHFVTFLPHVAQLDLTRLGPVVERADFFPQGINVEFVEIQTPHQALQRTWERGSGETLACGTGASAVAAVGIATGRLQSPVELTLLGGNLTLDWQGPGEPLYLTGPAEYSFNGHFYLSP